MEEQPADDDDLDTYATPYPRSPARAHAGGGRAWLGVAPHCKRLGGTTTAAGLGQRRDAAAADQRLGRATTKSRVGLGPTTNRQRLGSGDATGDAASSGRRRRAVPDRPPRGVDEQ